jgi:peroxiredoxin
MYRHTRRLFVGSLIALASASLMVGALRPTSAYSDDEKAKSNIAKTIAVLDLKDTASKAWSLADLKGKKAVVVVFVGTECPINNAYMPRLAEMHKEYAEKGVQFLAINSNKQDTADKIAHHAKEYKIPFPVLIDANQAAADQFGARKTPEAFVLDADLKVCFDGRIDDRFGLGTQRAQANREDLKLALDDVLAGRKVAEAEPPVAGCYIGRGAKPAQLESAGITYSKQVSRIIQNRCQECHRPGQIGPMALLTYDDVSNWSEMIREVVKEKRMPPWYADQKHHGQFRNERALSKEDYDTLLTWIDAGCPKGDERDLPGPKEFADTWFIGKPDVVFSMQEEFKVPAKAPPGGVKYQNFAVKTNFDEDKWIQAAECKPGNRAVVHHIIVYVNTRGKGLSADGLAQGMLGAYAPGELGSTYPPGAAKKLPKGATLLFQVHYTPNGVAATDRSTVGLVFAKEPPKVEVKSRAVSNFVFLIPPMNASYEVRSESVLQKDAIIYNLLPHMHLRGKDFKFDVVYPDGKQKTILYVPHYDFGWQATYYLKEPLKLPAGTTVKCVAHFDNSPGNPWNPDPTAEVRFGEQTWEEMMIGFIDYAYVGDAAPKKALDAETKK